MIEHAHRQQQGCADVPHIVEAMDILWGELCEERKARS
jgi:hypothetical protein